MFLYGCALWSLNCNEIKHLDVCFNKCLRRIWSLPANSHTGIVHCVSGCVSVYNVCFQRFCKLYQSACSSNNFLYVQFFVLRLSPVAILLDTILCLVRVLYGIIVVFP